MKEKGKRNGKGCGGKGAEIREGKAKGEEEWGKRQKARRGEGRVSKIE